MRLPIPDELAARDGGGNGASGRKTSPDWIGSRAVRLAGDLTALLDDVHATKRRYVSLCYRFQDLRYTFVELSAILQERPCAHLSLGPVRARPAFPVYAFTTRASCVVSMLPRPRVVGGAGAPLIRWGFTYSRTRHTRGDAAL